MIGDNYFDWATWSAVSIDGSAALSVAAPISSDNIGRKPVRGVEEAFRFRGGQCLRTPHQLVGDSSDLAFSRVKTLPPQLPHRSQHPWCLVLHPMRNLRLHLLLLQGL